MTSPATTAVASTGTSSPSVLAIVVVGPQAGPWVRECLLSLAQQAYPRVGVLAVDDGADRASRDLLVGSLGPRRVLRNERPVGFARSVRAALDRPVAQHADFILLVDPRAALDRDAVARLVEAAVGIGVEDVGIVGAKVVDRDRPRSLRDIGRSSDRFGHPSSPLQPGEIDQGQFDRVLEVLCVSPAAMLIARDAWERTGLFDERLDTAHADLDLCWRIRVAGYRILMTPLARVRIGDTGAEGRAAPAPHRGARYEEDRAAIAAMLKNYSLLSLLWVVPAAILLGAIRLVYLILGRRFEESYDVVAAWGWNVVNLPGTLARRRRVQKARRVRDRALRRFMESAGVRSPRWFATAERILEEQRAIDEADEGEPIQRRLRDRTASLVGSHPVIVGSFLAIVVGLVAVRELIGPDVLAGGALPLFPDRAGDLFAELASGVRSTPLGGQLSPSPALGALGIVSEATLGDPFLAQKAVLLAGPPLAAILMYRAAVRLSVRPGPAVVAAAAYGLGALTLWAFSDGRLGLLIALAILPAAGERIEAAFARDEPGGGRWRFVAGLAVTIAVGVAAYPGIVLAIGVLIAIWVLGGPVRLRGLVLCAGAAVGAAVLLFPFVSTILADGGRALTSLVGTTEPERLARLALGSAPGTWPVALYLPIAAAIGLALVRPPLRGPAARVTVAGGAGLLLSWLAAANRLPPALTNPGAYAGLAAVSMATLVGFGLGSFTGSLRLEAFGLRQVAGAVLGIVLAAGILLQSLAAMVGTWAVGRPQETIPPAWAVVSGTTPGAFRVLWLTGDHGDGLPPPAGDPTRRLQAGDATIRYALTDREGASVLDTGRPLAGPGPDRLEQALVEILGSTTRHGGALLAPFGVRFVVAQQALLPEAVARAFRRQVDVNLVPASGFTIFRNATTVPPAAVLETGPEASAVIASGEMATTATWLPVPSTPLEEVPGGWDGPAAEGTAFLSTEFDRGWELGSRDADPEVAFGWATSFPADGEPVRVRHDGGVAGAIRVALLAILWLAALWVTRKPVAR
ncbi:MAG TPA: glycosyltransferase family 2 protein [Actinomycetota bacterium]|nr:glycosyltransferase family 2 protein [Actinomycetota bacterium]